MEVTVGIEPTNNGFANRAISHSGTSPQKSNGVGSEVARTRSPCQFRNRSNPVFEGFLWGISALSLQTTLKGSRNWPGLCGACTQHNFLEILKGTG